MNYRLEIAKLYQKFPQPRTFEEDEAQYRICGHVIETSEVFIMGKAVSTEADSEAIASPYVAFPKHRQNAWFLHAMAGNLLAMYEAMPYHLPYVGWARRNGPVKWHYTEDAWHHISSQVPLYVCRLVA
jgi:hypothetical protein